MSRHEGFTLIEVLVALVVGTLVLLGAERVLGALSDQAGAMTARAIEADRDANGEEELHSLVGRLDVGTSETIPFAGDADTVRFSSWCEVPAGWLERCTVTLTFGVIDHKPVLVAGVDRRPSIVLLRGFTGGAFRYLESAAAGGHWFRRWGTGVTAPLGIGVILARGARTDTLLLRIGPRG